MKQSRLLEMERFILQEESVPMERLCSQFGVSMNTVRRDVAELIRRGSIEKVYGGVRVRCEQDQTLTPFEKRRLENAHAKQLIGRRAAEMVEDGDIIFLDSGTTTLQMMDFLKDRRDITVVTHNLEAVVRALPYEGIQVISLPGQLRRKTHSFTGMEAARSLRGYNIKTAFMAATGASVHGVTNSSSLEYEIKKTAIEHCDRSVLTLCSQKFGVSGLMTYANFDQFDAVVTDAAPPGAYAEAIKAGGARLIVADRQAAERQAAAR